MTELINKYPYFYELVLINNRLFNYVDNYNIRDEDMIDYIENKLRILNNEKSLNEELLLDTVSVILCMQPFYDGNSRTLKIYLRNYLNRFNKSININDNFIPVYYSNDDKLSERDLINFKNRIN